jgi:hypothetical protein
VRNANDRPFLVISSSISQGEKCQNSGGESWLRIKWRNHKTVNLFRASDVPQTATLFIHMFQSNVREPQLEITKHSRWHNVKIIRNILPVIYSINNCNDDKQFYWIKLP